MLKFDDAVEFTRIFLQGHLTATQALKVDTYKAKEKFEFYLGEYSITIDSNKGEISFFEGENLRRIVSMERAAGALMAISYEVEAIANLFNKSICAACMNRKETLEFLRN